MARRRDTHEQSPDDDSVGAATRALADATATLTRLLSHQVSAVGAEVSEAVAASLREAARGLSDASETVEKRTGASRADVRRQARVDRTRADLLDAAARVFAAQGYEGAAVGDIASAAGYTKGAVYANFGSKSDLFVALAREQVLCTSQAAAGAGAGTDPGSLADQLVAGMAEMPDGPEMLLTLEVLAYAVRHPESRDALRPVIESSLDDLASRVRDDRVVRAAGAARADEAPTSADRDTALGLVAVCTFATMLGAITGDRTDASGIGARLVDRLIND
ncbi:MAG TPA: helix-turn-helix domain-containing protein [Cellulomonadaceae bacterium]|nr:helix-turn-helix domain-containing protein [Cellulomonadaceae bacterium]